VLCSYLPRCFSKDGLERELIKLASKHFDREYGRKRNRKTGQTSYFSGRAGFLLETPPNPLDSFIQLPIYIQQMH
jgi:hypothetical protein